MNSKRENLNVVADVGNSWIKYATYRSDQPHAKLSLEKFRCQNEIEIALGEENHCWFVASVNRRGGERLRQFVDRHRPHDQWFDIGFEQLPIQNKLDHPEQTGIDRFCAAAAAVQLVKNQDKVSPAIVIDIGTAVTVDAVDADGIFLGGSIFLGPAKALQELNRQTDALPDLSDRNDSGPMNPIGTNTEDALWAGTLISLVGGIKEIADRQLQQLGQPGTVLLTGGGIPYVRDLIPPTWLVVDDLVLRGVQLAAQSITESNVTDFNTA